MDSVTDYVNLQIINSYVYHKLTGCKSVSLFLWITNPYQLYEKTILELPILY